MLHGEHPGHGGRTRGPAHHAGRHAHGLSEPRPAEQDPRRLAGDQQRRGGVQHDQGARAGVPLRAEEDLVDALGLVDVFVDRGDPLDRLVARHQARVRAAAGAHRLGKVERLHAVAVEVDGRQLVTELGGRLQVGQSAAAHRETLKHVRGAGAGAEDPAVGAAERQAELGSAPGQHEGRRRGRQRALHEVLVQEDPPAVAAGSSRTEQGDGLIVLDEDAGPPEHTQRALVDGGHGGRHRGGLRQLGAEAHAHSSAENPSTSASMRAASSSGSGAGWCVSSSWRALRRAFSLRSSPPSSCQRTCPWRLMIVGPPLRLAHVLRRVPVGEEVAAGADVADHVDGERLGGDLDAGEELAVHGQELVRQHDQLQRSGHAEVEVPEVVVQVGPDGQAEKGQFGRLHARLRVDHLRVGGAGVAPVGQVEPARQLDSADVAHEVLGRVVGAL